MQETDTKITVSSINDINSFNLERIITVKGTIDNMSLAEAQISAKLRQSYENDLQAMAPQTMMFPGLHPMAMMATAGKSSSLLCCLCSITVILYFVVSQFFLISALLSMVFFRNACSSY